MTSRSVLLSDMNDCRENFQWSWSSTMEKWKRLPTALQYGDEEAIDNNRLDASNQMPQMTYNVCLCLFKFSFLLWASRSITTKLNKFNKQRYCNLLLWCLLILMSCTVSATTFCTTCYDCGGASDITIPSSVTSIASFAFMSCGTITNVTISSSVTSIGTYAFAFCYSLKNVSIPSSVTTIESNAFYQTALVGVTLPSGLTSIADSTFSQCRSLRSIVIPSGVTSIGVSAFDSCSSLTTVTFPSGLTTIGNSAFYGCSMLTGITIPSTVTTIGYESFYFCSSLISVTIPASVTSIDTFAFGSCVGLTSATILTNALGLGTFYSCTSLQTVTIATSVTSLGFNAFQYCTSVVCVSSGFSSGDIQSYFPDSPLTGCPPTPLPSSQPSSQPTRQPTRQPISHPTNRPTTQPTFAPSRPTSQPSGQPSSRPSRHPTSQPTVQPTSQPTFQPSSQPTFKPSGPSSQPTSQPTAHPSRQPTCQPTVQPSTKPSRQPSSQPSEQPTRRPSLSPSRQPSSQPSSHPTSQPTRCPSVRPSSQPSRLPTAQPSKQPLGRPSSQPTLQPTIQPSSKPSCQPTDQPSAQPTRQPFAVPSSQPSRQPSTQPTVQPFSQPSVQPTLQPTSQPSRVPTNQPTRQPTVQPTLQPSRQPSGQPSGSPSGGPTSQPTRQPSIQPSSKPSAMPTQQPSNQPSRQPSTQPISKPTSQPTRKPSSQPTICPTQKPSRQPTTQPSSRPSNNPTRQPSSRPSTQPSSQPSIQPASHPSSHPSLQPSSSPTTLPSSVPSRHPSSQPSVQPSRRPSSQPSQQPNAAPSRQPVSRPSSQPTSVPTRVPSGQPSRQPSVQPSSQPTRFPSAQPISSPSRQPTSHPSSVPSRQPFAHPSAQPFSRPSSQPTHQPNSFPTSQPSKVPRSAPSSQPSRHPSSQPSEQPTNSPSCQPSHCPSGIPSVFPSCQPSTQPTSQPTINGSACAVGHFYDADSNFCPPCPVHSNTTILGRQSCTCNSGYSGTGFGRTLVCTMCERGTYELNSVCVGVPAGAYVDSDGSSSFTYCPLGTYSSKSNQTACTPCSGGKNTPFVGAISSAQCVSPIPNFTLGTIALSVVAVLFIWYIVLGRFHRVAFDRRQSVVIPLSSCCVKTTLMLKSTITEKEIKDNTLGSYAKITIFVAFSIVCCLMVTIILYVLIVYQVFFNSLIMWRGIEFSLQLSPIEDLMSSILTDLAAYCRLPTEAFLFLLYPFLYILRKVSSINLSLNAVSVTCQGAQAPIELLIDCSILGFAIIFIRCDYQLLFNITLPGLNQTFLMTRLVKGDIWRNKNVFLCMIFMMFNNINPFQMVLRYAMGIVVIGNFVANRGFAHNVTTSCDQVPNLRYFDSILGYSSSIVFWLLVFPAVYILSDVIVPRSVNNDKAFGKNGGSPLDESSQSSKGRSTKLSQVVHEVEIPQHIHDDYITDIMSGLEEEDRKKISEVIQSSKFHIRRKAKRSVKVSVSRGSEFDQAVIDDLLSFVSEEDRKRLAKVSNSSEFQLRRAAATKNIDIGESGDVPIKSSNSYARKALRYTSAGSTYFISSDLWLVYIADVWVQRLQQIAGPQREFHWSHTGTILETSNNNSEKKEKNRFLLFEDSVASFRKLQASQSKKMIGMQSLSARNESFKKSLDRFNHLKNEEQSKLNALWVTTELHNLPTYYQLCLTVKEEMFDFFHRKFGTRDLGFLAVLIAFSGVGHMFSKYGRSCWSIVLNKYKMFLMVCVGIWTEEAFIAYDLKSTAEIISTDGIVEVMPQLIGNVVSSRAILYQIVPALSVLSVTIMAFSSSPLFLRSPSLRKLMPEMLIKNSFSIALEREMEESKVMKSVLLNYCWRLRLKALIIFVSESRLLQTFSSVITLALSIVLLFYSPKLLVVVVVLLCLLLPFIVIKSFLFLIYFGKTIALKDSDFEKVFGYRFNSGIIVEEEKVDDVEAGKPTDSAVNKELHMVEAQPKNVDADSDLDWADFEPDLDDSEPDVDSKDANDKEIVQVSRDLRDDEEKSTDFATQGAKPVEGDKEEIHLHFPDHSRKDGYTNPMMKINYEQDSDWIGFIPYKSEEEDASLED